MGTTRRLFVAVRPPPTLCSDLASGLDRSDDEPIRWDDPDGYHVTLHFLGQSEVGEVSEAMTRAVVDQPAVEIVLGPGLQELGSAVVIPALGADDLARRIRAAVEALGEPAHHDRFVGHLTVGRWRRGQRRPEILDQAATGRFIAHSVELLASSGRGDAGPSTYETIGAWPLVGP